MIYETVKGFVIIKLLVDKCEIIWFSCYLFGLYYEMSSIFLLLHCKVTRKFLKYKCYVPRIRTS